MEILVCNNLSYGFPLAAPLLANLNLTLENHELLLITGPNGSGKSTFLQVLLDFPPAKILQGGIVRGVSLQQTAWIPQIEQAEFHLPLTLRDLLGGSSVEEIQALGLLTESQLGLAWNSASGGERKRALLTRALLRRPRLLLLDEPMNHLDKVSEAAIVEVLSRYLRENDAAAVIVSHDALSASERSLFQLKELKFGEVEP